MFTRNRLTAGVLVALAVFLGACGGTSQPKAPARSEVVQVIQSAIPDLRPAAPSESAAFHRLLEACAAVQRMATRLRDAGPPLPLSSAEMADMSRAASVCPGDPSTARDLLSGID